MNKTTGNGPAIAAMLVAMATLILNDTLIKLASSQLPSGQIMAVRGTIAACLIAVMAWRTGAFASLPLLKTRPVFLRVGAEIGATVTFLLALFNMPIGNVVALMQVTPLCVIAGAALFLREPVGWRRWAAALIGFAGVMLIIRPGTSAFTPWAMLALVTVVFSASRDLATRRIDPALPSILVTLVTAVAVTITGYLMFPLQEWQPLSGREFGLLAMAAIAMSTAYHMLVLAMRSGDMSVVAPFRYTMVLWAMLAGYVVWNEFPDTLALIGTAIVIGAGLYSFVREQRLKRFS